MGEEFWGDKNNTITLPKERQKSIPAKENSEAEAASQKPWYTNLLASSHFLAEMA